MSESKSQLKRLCVQNPLGMAEELAKLKRERDELAAQIEVKDAALRRIAGNNLQLNPCVVAESALSITPFDALREIQARTLEEAATNWVYGAGSASDMLREMAAAQRKGEKK